jgi:hypothetical protein
MKIIGIAGEARHGKDTTANIIKYHMESLGKNVLIIHYAYFLKTICRDFFGWDGEKDIVGRTILQAVGTDKARNRNPDIWVNMVIEFIKAFGQDYDYIIIPDCRFKNEFDKLHEESFNFNVFSLWVHRKNFDNGLTEEQKRHPSETSLFDYKFDSIISVETNMPKLVDAVHNMIRENKFFTA